MDEDQIDRLLHVIQDKRDRAMFLLAYRHGLRASEVGLLSTTDVHFHEARISIHRLKGSHSGEHHLELDEEKALRGYLRTRNHTLPILFPSRLNKPISRKTLEWLMKKYGEAAHLPQTHRHFHVLRHSLAIHLLKAGRSRHEVRYLLGHANLQNTDVYLSIVEAL